MHADPTAAALADFVHALTPAAVPSAMRERALHLALDAIGCALAYEVMATQAATAANEMRYRSFIDRFPPEVRCPINPIDPHDPQIQFTRKKPQSLPISPISPLDPCRS